MDSQVLNIIGMTCAQRIGRFIGKLEGVATLSVNLAIEKAMVAYDPQVIRLSAIRQSIERIGYKALSIESTYYKRRFTTQ